MEYTASISPNEKYRHVINNEWPDGAPQTEADWEAHPHAEASEAYQVTIQDAPTAEEIEADWEDRDPLSWSMFSVASDPDLLGKMATYFDGVEPDEPADLIRAKLRLIADPQIYANAQIAANAELRDAQPAPA